MGAIELGYMLDCAEAPASGRWSARRAAAPSTAPISRSATTRSGSNTSTSSGPTMARRSPTPRSPSPSGNRKRGRTDGRLHDQSQALPAGEWRGRLLGGVRGRARSLALGPRRPAAGEGPRRRLARRALLLPGGDLRLLRDEDQRPVRARLPDPDRRGAGARRQESLRCRRGRRGQRDRDRADGQHAGDQGSGHRHGVDPLGQDPPRHPVAAAATARRPSASTSSSRNRWSTSPSRWPASSAAPASPPASRWKSTRSSSARRRWPRPTASSATRATPRPTSAHRPRPRPARDLRLHPLLQLRRRLPEGRGADGPDHAPAPQGRRERDRGPEQRPLARDGLRQHHREEGHARRVACCCRSPSRPA